MEQNGFIYAVGIWEDIEGSLSTTIIPIEYRVMEDDEEGSYVTFSDDSGKEVDRYFEDYGVETADEIDFKKLNEMLDDLGDLDQGYEIIAVCETRDQAKEELKRYINKNF